MRHRVKSSNMRPYSPLSKLNLSKPSRRFTVCNTLGWSWGQVCAPSKNSFLRASPSSLHTSSSLGARAGCAAPFCSLAPATASGRHMLLVRLLGAPASTARCPPPLLAPSLPVYVHVAALPLPPPLTLPPFLSAIEIAAPLKPRLLLLHSPPPACPACQRRRRWVSVPPIRLLLVPLPQPPPSFLPLLPSAEQPLRPQVSFAA